MSTAPLHIVDGHSRLRTDAESSVAGEGVITPSPWANHLADGGGVDAKRLIPADVPNPYKADARRRYRGYREEGPLFLTPAKRAGLMGGHLTRLMKGVARHGCTA